jgi:hypothetical protein
VELRELLGLRLRALRCASQDQPGGAARRQGRGRWLPAFQRARR